MLSDRNVYYILKPVQCSLRDRRFTVLDIINFTLVSTVTLILWFSWLVLSKLPFILLLININSTPPLSLTLSGSGGCVHLQNEPRAFPLFSFILATPGSQEDFYLSSPLGNQRSCGFPLRLHMKLSARLELETSSKKCASSWPRHSLYQTSPACRKWQ